MKFNERLRILRHDLGLTQTDLSKKLGVGRTTISEYEKGKIVPKKDGLIKLANIFGVSVEYLLGLTDEELPLYNNEKENLNKSIRVEDHILACMSKIKHTDLDEYNIIYKNRKLNKNQLELMYEELRCCLIMFDRISKIEI